MRPVCCISPSRLVQESLAPALARHLPGIALREVQRYPLPADVGVELGETPPQVCFVDAMTDRSKVLELIPGIVKHNNRIPIVVILGGSQPDLILKCLRLGAREFLPYPFEDDQLTASLEKLGINAGSGDSGKLARVITVVPAKGACGASTLACNLAFRTKRQGSDRVLLADLDPLTGSISFMLKLKSAYSFLDVLQLAASLDGDLWKGMIATHGGVDVLLAPELLVQGISEARDATAIVEFARNTYDVVVLDVATAYGDWNLSAIRSADDILVVTTNELPALHGAQRTLAYLESHAVPKWKIHTVVNRYDQSLNLNEEVVASSLQADVMDTLPSDFETVQQALLAGKPIAHNSNLGRALSHLADRINGREKEPPPKPAPFGGLMSLFFRTSS